MEQEAASAWYAENAQRFVFLVFSQTLFVRMFYELLRTENVELELGELGPTSGWGRCMLDGTGEVEPSRCVARCSTRQLPFFFVFFCRHSSRQPLVLERADGETFVCGRHRPLWACV